jgi:hypothetical protein
MMLSGISTVTMTSMRTSDLSEPSGSIMPVSRMPQGMQLASLESTLIVEPTVRRSEISTFAERFLFKSATPEESADAEADADAAPDAPATGKAAASPGGRAPAARSAAKLPPATAAAAVPAPAQPKKIHTADLSQDPNLHVDTTSKTAIYDISAHAVYLPNGRRLEAHSGLGPHMDDIRYVNLKARGPTPPNVYQLTMREEIFHGVRAIRLNPVDETRMYGRDGILAHTYMLGPNGQSNGCISFADYNAFLNAYSRGARSTTSSWWSIWATGPTRRRPGTGSPTRSRTSSGDRDDWSAAALHNFNVVASLSPGFPAAGTPLAPHQEAGQPWSSARCASGDGAADFRIGQFGPLRPQHDRNTDEKDGDQRQEQDGLFEP